MEEPIVCDGCGNVPEHCLCNEIIQSEQQVLDALAVHNENNENNNGFDT